MKRSFEDGDDDINDDQSPKSSPQNFKGKVKEQSSCMSALLEKMKALVERKNLRNACAIVQLHGPEWIGQVDAYERNILHLSVESGNKFLVEALLLSGAPVNEGEGCRLTLLMIAINGRNVNMVKILLR